MGKSNGHTRWWLLPLWLLIACLLLAGCVTTPPQPITGLQPTQAPTEAPDPADTESLSSAGETPEPVAETQAQASRTPVSSAAPTQVELFYSGMPSLMGFADAPQATVYENAMDALPAVVSLLWPSAAASYFRYGADIAKEDMRLSKDALLGQIRSPSFYRDEPLLTEPARLKYDGRPLSTGAQNLNEPVASFYETMGLDIPTALGGQAGTQVAIGASDTSPTSLTLIVTDLHELRMDDGALLTALSERCLQVGRTVGIAAIGSEFAGYIPDIGESNTTFVWGSPPTGTLDYMLDFTDYDVGISIDPEQREMATRPFYVLVIGEQGAVDSYLAALTERLEREFAGNAAFRMNTAVYGNSFVPAEYALAGNMRYTAGQGVTAIAEPSAPAGVSLVELKASQQERFLQWALDYTLHPSDPRGLSLAAGDFTFIAEAVGADGTRTTLPDLRWEIDGAEGGQISLSLTLTLPQGILPQGSYTLEVSGSLTAPANLPGTDWLARYGYDADGAQLYDMEQNATAFDGSRTLFLSRLIDTLGKANINRLGVASLGMVQIALTVYA